MMAMLKKYNPINMAIGMPDYEALPNSIREALADVAPQWSQQFAGYQYSVMPVSYCLILLCFTHS